MEFRREWGAGARHFMAGPVTADASWLQQLAVWLSAFAYYDYHHLQLIPSINSHGFNPLLLKSLLSPFIKHRVYVCMTEKDPHALYYPK